jgi:hypothetical protein
MRATQWCSRILIFIRYVSQYQTMTLDQVAVSVGIDATGDPHLKSFRSTTFVTDPLRGGLLSNISPSYLSICSLRLVEGVSALVRAELGVLQPKHFDSTAKLILETIALSRMSRFASLHDLLPAFSPLDKYCHPFGRLDNCSIRVLCSQDPQFTATWSISSGLVSIRTF